MPVHPDAERLQPAQHQPRVERAGDGADRVLVERDLLGELEVAYDEGAADDVGVAAAVLRGRVHDDVGTERQRLLEVRRGEGVVDDQQGTGLVRDGGQRLDVADVEQRVGRRLDPDHLRAAGLDRGAHRVDVADRRRRCARAPSGCSTLSKSRWVPPYASSGITTWSPGSQTARSRVSSAASPEANANPRSPSSSAAMLPSSAVRVGLAERLYS